MLGEEECLYEASYYPKARYLGNSGALDENWISGLGEFFPTT